MPEPPRMIKMGPASPELNLPPASIPHRHDSDDEEGGSLSDDDRSERPRQSPGHHSVMEEEEEEEEEMEEEEMETLSDDFSLDSRAFAKARVSHGGGSSAAAHHGVRSFPDEPPRREMQECISQLRDILRSQEAKRSEGSSSDSDKEEAEEEDLDSNAFMWDVSSMPLDYLDVLDKAIEQQSPTLLGLITRLGMDDMNVEIALKEMIATEEETLSILKRMRARKPRPCAARDVKRLTAASSCGAPPKLQDTFRNMVRPLLVNWSVKSLMQNSHYAYTLDRDTVHLYNTASLPDVVGVDVEDQKVAVLERLLGPMVKKYNTQYKQLREAFRDAVTSGDYDTPKEGVEPETPYEWVTRMVAKTQRFNVPSFIHDSKIGELENKRQFFGSTTVLSSQLSYFVARDKHIVKDARNFTFDLGKTDDILQRFAKHSEDSTDLDLTLILAKLSVYLSKPCVLLRFFIHYHYPNVAIWLRLIEHYEHDVKYKVLSPYFPPLTTELLQFQLTETGILDNTDKFISLAPLTPYVPPTPPPRSYYAPTPPSPARPPPSRYAGAAEDVLEASDDEDGAPSTPPPPLVSYMPPPPPASPDIRFSSLLRFFSKE